MVITSNIAKVNSDFGYHIDEKRVIGNRTFIGHVRKRDERVTIPRPSLLLSLLPVFDMVFIHLFKAMLRL